MNNIYSRQNEESFLKLLRAFKSVYRYAKRLNVLLFFVSALIPLMINVSFLLFENHAIKSLLCLVALSMILVAFALNVTIDYYKEIGALIQQQYDLSLFGMGDLSVAEKSRIEKYIIKFGNNHFDKELNWYEDYSKCKEDLAVLFCQKENVGWTSRLVDRYLLFAIVIAVITLIPIVIGFIIFNSDFYSILQLIYNTIPILSYLFYSIYESFNERIKIVRIKDCLNFLLKNAENKRSIRKDLMVLQNMIFDFRKTKRTIPEWLYNLYYKKDSAYEEMISKIE